MYLDETLPEPKRFRRQGETMTPPILALAYAFGLIVVRTLKGEQLTNR